MILTVRLLVVVFVVAVFYAFDLTPTRAEFFGH